MPEETLFGLVSGCFYGSIKTVDYTFEDGIESVQPKFDSFAYSW